MEVKKILLSSLAPLTVVSTISLTTGCSKEETLNTVMYWKASKFANTITVFDASSLSKEWKVTLASLAGILAQDKVQLFIKYGDERDNWFDDVRAKNGFKVDESITDVWQLLDKFKNTFDSKYILYSRNMQKKGEEIVNMSTSINSACTIAAVKHYLVVDKELEDEFQDEFIEHGFSQAYDARNIKATDFFDNEESHKQLHQIRKQLSNKMLINQNPDNESLRDYAIASKSFISYVDYEYNYREQMVQWQHWVDTLANWLVPNAPILGWNDGETDFVEYASSKHLTTLASDHCKNLSFYTADEGKKLSQRKQETITPDNNKHYLAIIMSDGDNAQWLQGNFINSTDYFGYDRSQYDFPMTWTVNPSVYDLCPTALEAIYKKQTEKDSFIAGPSGWAYINPSDYAVDHINEWKEINDRYMADCDLSVINFLDWRKSDSNKLAPFMANKKIKGGVWSVADWYIGGNGSVSWVNDKPLLAMREGLWTLSGRTEDRQFLNNIHVANRINSYPRNPYSIEGYTCLIVHAWSLGKMPNIKDFVNLLKNDVQIISVEQMIDMISKNVPHKDAAPEDYAFKHRDD